MSDTDLTEQIARLISNEFYAMQAGERPLPHEEPEVNGGDMSLAAAIVEQIIPKVRAEAWDEGFDSGHYVNDQESRDCECRVNPYREEGADRG
jgi:hypothetical protein